MFPEGICTVVVQEAENLAAKEKERPPCEVTEIVVTFIGKPQPSTKC